MKIHIPEDCTQINVLVSGGADSALLLYLLVLENRTRNLPIVCYGMGKRKNLFHIENVVQWISDNLHVQCRVQITEKFFFIRKFVESILLISESNSYVFSACNKVVENQFTPTRYIAGDTPPVRGPAFNEMHVRPFIDMDKIEVSELYKHHHLQDLFLKTHSCGTDIHDHCGECYFCLERAWGVDNSGLFSIGISHSYK